MMRKTPANAMQKTYDECYLICSTAIYFEGLNNEGEALRAWRNALDQIYYHNAYKMPSGFVPRSETEKALQDSLRTMELQCKERVDLLEALKKSRKEAAEEDAAKTSGSEAPSKSRESLLSVTNKPSSTPGNAPWMGGNTVPPSSYSDLPRPPPATDRRPPALLSRATDDRPQPTKQSSGDEYSRTMSLQSNPPATLAPPTESREPRTRTPSPEKKGGMLRTLRSNPKERSTSSGKMATTLRNRPQNTAASRAATQVWSGPRASVGSAAQVASDAPPPATTWDPQTKRVIHRSANRSGDERRTPDLSVLRPSTPSDYVRPKNSHSSLEEGGSSRNYYSDSRRAPNARQNSDAPPARSAPTTSMPPPPPAHAQKPLSPPTLETVRPAPTSLADLGPSSITYMKEYPNHPPLRPKQIPTTQDPQSEPNSLRPRPTPPIPRKQVNRAAGVVSATAERRKLDDSRAQLSERTRADPKPLQRGGVGNSDATKRTRPRQDAGPARAVTPPSTDESPDSDHPDSPTAQEEWDNKVKKLMKELPRGVDEAAARQIFQEIVIQGDEVHWDDVAGLDNAKSALKETVVYPFLRPDLFMGLREPARGMLLFGPPGTGKTMLARAVATESKSIFFAISASSLTSKFLGESEKLVRALFAIAKQVAPSIIFVDEIDSLLGSRGGSSEHEATRRIKTEFLIQWSDLQRAAAGREDKDKGDATRVLVLAATNLPWAIDEAARRRFVRRQYIPLPEDWVREKQLLNLLSAQNHSLKDRELKQLVRLTDGFSGSDITALAKDAAVGPLRSLGEKLLHMSPDEIRPIGIQDFQASLEHIRPSVSKQGLKEFEDWAQEFGTKG